MANIIAICRAAGVGPKTVEGMTRQQAWQVIHAMLLRDALRSLAPRSDAQRQ